MAKAGDKYIIEIDGAFAKTTNHGCEKLYRIKGFNSLVFDENGLSKLEKYKEQKKDDIKVGMRVRTTKNKDHKGCTLFPVGTIGVVEKIDSISSKIPYKIMANGGHYWYSRDMFEVIKEEEIKVGDEVIDTKDGTELIITHVHQGFKGYYDSISKDGYVYSFTDPYARRYKKTGRHFDGIAKVLKGLQEGE